MERKYLSLISLALLVSVMAIPSLSHAATEDDWEAPLAHQIIR